MKTVVITGSARGLGFEMAKVFKKNNYNVVISDLNEDNLQKAEEATKEAGEKIVETLKKKSYVNDAHIDIKGKILNIIVEVKSGTSEKTAKELGDVVLNSANDKTKKLYDLQLFITNEKKDAKGFPIIGYKNFKEKSFAF